MGLPLKIFRGISLTELLSDCAQPGQPGAALQQQLQPLPQRLKLFGPLQRQSQQLLSCSLLTDIGLLRGCVLAVCTQQSW